MSPSWVIGGMIGLTILIIQIISSYTVNFNQYGILRITEGDMLLLVNETLNLQFHFSELLLINGLVYFILGALLALLLYKRKTRMPYRESKGVRRVAFSLAIIPLINLMAHLYHNLEILKLNIFSFSLPLQQLKNYVNETLSFLQIDRIILQWFYYLKDSVHIWQALIFITIIFGILCLKKWSYYGILLIASYAVANVILFFINNPGLYFIQTLKNSIVLCYFTILIIFLTNPDVRDQFRRKVQGTSQ